MDYGSRLGVRSCGALTLLLSLVACGSSGTVQTPTPTPTPGASQLRQVLQGENIAEQAALPAVSDELFELGQALFFDKILSGNNDVSCAACHWPELAGADARTLPQGVGGTGLGTSRINGTTIPRNSPTILNAHLLTEVFHDGRVEASGASLETPAGTSLTPAMRAIFDSQWELLAAQALFPVVSREEMRGSNGSNAVANLADTDFTGIWDALRDRLVAFTAYQSLFFAAYPSLTSIADIEFAHAANAIAAFEVRAFGLTDSPFERFVAGDDSAMTAAQVAGAIEFFGAAGCARCHSGSAFTDGEFHNIGLPQFGPGKGDGAGSDDDFGRERVTGSAADRYRFRTSPLLNIELTAPYGRLGQYDDLRAMVDHYTDAPTMLQNYDILQNVTDSTLIGTLVANTSAISVRISNRVALARNFDVDAVVTFLGALTADSAVDMSGLVPASVPSGLTVR